MWGYCNIGDIPVPPVIKTFNFVILQTYGILPIEPLNLTVWWICKFEKC